MFSLINKNLAIPPNNHNSLEVPLVSSELHPCFRIYLKNRARQLEKCALFNVFLRIDSMRKISFLRSTIIRVLGNRCVHQLACLRLLRCNVVVDVFISATVARYHRTNISTYYIIFYENIHYIML